MEQNLNVYVSYAHEDEAMKSELEKHLTALRRSGKINLWSDKTIEAGSKWDEELTRELQRADIILLLLSSDYLSSDFLYQKEFSVALERQQAGGAAVLPIILRPCFWQETPIAKLQVLPSSGKAISEFDPPDNAYVEIVRAIQEIANSFVKTPKWLQLIDEEKKRQTGTLDLSDCQLHDVPSQVKEMTWLKVLNLKSNQISKIEGMEGLSALEELDLSSNQISKIEGLANLPALKRLNLISNQISKIEGLESLSTLERLYLSANRISKIEGLQSLPALVTLTLDFNQISKIENLQGLPALKRLSLATNQINKIEGLQDLPVLQELYLSSNHITKIEGLQSLPALNWLDLDYNQIEDIEGLQDLVFLRTLNLSSNQINKIKGMEVFPTALDSLSLFDNPIADISPAIFGTSNQYDCLDDLKNFFAEQVEINVPEVKLILTGNSDVGKTTFSTFLTTGVYDATRNSTHGLRVIPYELDDTTKKEYGFPPGTKITIWDFGGQEYFHNTHQLFFNRHAVYIFLWEKATNKNSPIQTVIKSDSNGNSVSRVLEHFDADYWLSNIRHFAPEAAVVLVQNKVDVYEEKGEPLEWLPYACLKRYGCKDQYHISLFKSAGKATPATGANLVYWYDFEKLKYVMLVTLKNFVSQNKEGNIYNRVRQKIEEKRKDHFWPVEDFEAFVEDLKKKSTNANAQTIDNRRVAEHFNRQGKLLYPSSADFTPGDVLFTDPQWLSEKIYEILNDAVLQRNGFFDEKDLDELVKAGKFESRQLLNQIVSLMKQYNIVFFNPNKQQHIAPQYLPEVPNVAYSQVKKLLAVPKLVIKVDGFLPKSVINSLIATYAIKGDETSFYKYGVKTQEKDGTILLIETDYLQKKIYVYTDAPELYYRRNVFAEILGRFGIKINNPVADTASKNLLPSEMESPVTPPPNLKLYISIDDNVFVDWVELWNTHRSPDKGNEYCTAEDGNMVLRKMFAPYYLPYTEVRSLPITGQVKPSRLFISYSSKNTEFMRRFVTHLEPLRRNGTVALWNDRMIEPGTKWDNTIKEELKAADLIVFLLSPDFIATNYIFENEIPQAIKQLESNNSKLFFVELQACSWERTVLARFQQTTDPTADNKGVIVIEEPMNDKKWREVVTALEKKIAKK